MVQIVVRIPESSGGVGVCGEWGIIELQGELETRRPVPLNGATIGDLHFNNKDQAILVVGHHIIYGKVLSMEKPFAVLAKVGGDLGNLGAMETDRIPMETDQQEAAVRYNVVALVKKKILFNSRPKPIIANAPQKL